MKRGTTLKRRTDTTLTLERKMVTTMIADVGSGALCGLSDRTQDLPEGCALAHRRHGGRRASGNQALCGRRSAELRLLRYVS